MRHCRAALTTTDEIGRRILAIDRHRRAGRMEDRDASRAAVSSTVSPGRELFSNSAAARSTPFGSLRARSCAAIACAAAVAPAENAVDAGGRRGGLQPERRQVLAPVRRESGDLAALPALAVGDRDPVAREEMQHDRAAARAPDGARPPA